MLESVSHAEPLALTNDLSFRMVEAEIEDRRRFLSLLESYDGERLTFTQIIIQTLTRQGLSQADLADICDSSSGSISRWTRGAAPTKLARKAAVSCICAALKDRLAGIQEEFDMRAVDRSKIGSVVAVEVGRGGRPKGRPKMSSSSGSDRSADSELEYVENLA